MPCASYLCQVHALRVLYQIFDMSFQSTSLIKLVFDRCPHLETLSLKRSSMAHAVLNCPVLQDLDIGSCHKLTDAAIRSAATSCPLLESLDMSNCSCVSDDTLREIALTCANLHILDASYCPNISLEVCLPSLNHLCLCRHLDIPLFDIFFCLFSFGSL